MENTIVTKHGYGSVHEMTVCGRNMHLNNVPFPWLPATEVKEYEHASLL